MDENNHIPMMSALASVFNQLTLFFRYVGSRDRGGGTSSHAFRRSWRQMRRAQGIDRPTVGHIASFDQTGYFVLV